jgi:hypothetical protein
MSTLLPPAIAPLRSLNVVQRPAKIQFGSQPPEPAPENQPDVSTPQPKKRPIGWTQFKEQVHSVIQGIKAFGLTPSVPIDLATDRGMSAAVSKLYRLHRETQQRMDAVYQLHQSAMRRAERAFIDNPNEKGTVQQALAEAAALERQWRDLRLTALSEQTYASRQDIQARLEEAQEALDTMPAARLRRHLHDSSWQGLSDHLFNELVDTTAKLMPLNRAIRDQQDLVNRLKSADMPEDSPDVKSVGSPSPTQLRALRDRKIETETALLKDYRREQFILASHKMLLIDLQELINTQRQALKDKTGGWFQTEPVIVWGD